MLSDKGDYKFICISTAEISVLKCLPLYGTICYILGRVLLNLLNYKVHSLKWGKQHTLMGGTTNRSKTTPQGVQ